MHPSPTANDPTAATVTLPQSDRAVRLLAAIRVTLVIALTALVLAGTLVALHVAPTFAAAGRWG